MTVTYAQLQEVLLANPDLRVDEYPRKVTTAPTPGLSEHDLQAAVIAECDRRAVHDPRFGLIFAIPNGSHRHPAVAAKLKAEGVRAGVPDLFLPVASRGHHGLWLELKVGRNQTTAAQDEWARRLKGQGYCCHVVRSFEAALRWIEWYLNGASCP